jgi:hypothetical protein
MMRLSIVPGSGLLDGLVWACMASLLLSPIYVVGLGVVTGFMTMLLLTALISTQRANDFALMIEQKPAAPLKREHRTALQVPG